MSKKPSWRLPWSTSTGLSIWDADGHIVAQVAMRGTELEREFVGRFIVAAANSFSTTSHSQKDPS